jgi:RNA polymerase sigma-70 factor (ECF subfamily)
MLLQVPGLVSSSPAETATLEEHSTVTKDPAKGRPLEDATLLDAARNGDRNAFRLLVDKYHGQVAATVIGMLGPAPEARDVGQETFVRFYQALGRFRGEATVGTYLTRIAMNLCLNEIRRRRRHARLREAAWEHGARSVDGRDDAEARDFREKTHAAVLRLDPEFRAVVVLCWMEERTAREAAEILGIPLGTALSRLHRARQSLRAWLDPEEEKET